MSVEDGICMENDLIYSKGDLCSESSISTLLKRRDLHLLLYMHKQSNNAELLKVSRF